MSSTQSPRYGWKRRALLGLIPSLCLVAGLESLARIGEWASPAMVSLPLPGEYSGLLVPHAELGWRLRPRWRGMADDTLVSISPKGFRGPTDPPAQPHDFVILSLGESSTFGAGVRDEETYSALLETLLNKESATRYRVINAGVPAWSSYQSLRFLRDYALELHPDLVLFYHELNDYFPASLRDSSNNEIGASRTDRQWYESRGGSIVQSLLAHSALYRFAAFRMARHQIESLQEKPAMGALPRIGLPDLRLPPRLRLAEAGDQLDAGFDEASLPTRVSESERLDNFWTLRSICREHGIDLVIIHPSYADSMAHECLLTRFCAESHTPMFEAHEALHSDAISPRSLFRDSWHPTALGHRRLAESLARFLQNANIVPSRFVTGPPRP